MIDVDLEQQVGRFTLRARFTVDAPVVGLFGRSGAGKSTLVNAIAGVTTPRRGHVRVDDVVLFDSERRIDLSPQERRIGYVFQDSLLFPHLSVEANLLYGHRLRAEAVRFIEPRHVIDVLGLATLLHRSPGALSGGEKQRVAIGRALLAQPRILLLDEPLASLDVTRRMEILDYIECLRDEFRIPIVYVSHSVAEITRLADTLVVLSAGECVGAGDVETVMGRLDLGPSSGRYEKGAVVETRVAAHDLDFDLTTLRFDGGELTVPGVNAIIGERVRARIRARDVSLAVHRPTGISIVNILAGNVTAIHEMSGPVVDVEIAVGEALLFARITRRSRADLGIEAGQRVYALVKAVSFDHRSTGFA
jgi:molybdate transport system ATP-binding protein